MMNISFEKRLNSPIIQALLVLAVSIVFMAFGWVYAKWQPENADHLFAWSIGSAFMLFFALANSLLSLRADSFMKYWQASMYSYIVLAFLSTMFAWLFSGITIGNAGSYRWIYLVVSVGFIVFLSIVNFMKIIVRYAEKEEWNEPRMRK